MGLFDDIAKAALNNGFSTQAFAGPGYESVWSQLKPWLARITTNGVLKWIPRAASQLPCQIPQYENGFPVGPCVFHALETCLVCGRPVCLNHAFLEGQEGNAVCYLCVVQMREKMAPGSTKQAQPEPPPQTASARVVAEQKAWWARGILNVQEGVPWADVKKQYRTFSAQYHPDKSTGDERRFKDIQMAYDTLKLIYGEN